MATTKTPKKLKIGTKVKVIRWRERKEWPFAREKYTSPGRIAGSDDKANGRWYSVNLAAKGANAKLINVRASQVEVAA